MGLTILNINASRVGKREKLNDLLAIINSPGIVCIQEINIRSAFLYFQDYFQVIVNKDDNQNEDIGIITLVSRKYDIEQNIIAGNGRIIETKLR